MKPMLAAPTDGTALNYPIMASPKLDGIRCMIVDGTAYSRSMKPIPNKAIQTLFGHYKFNGLDGELIAGSHTHPNVFNKTSSVVMSKSANPGEVRFHVFDMHDYPKQKFQARLLRAWSITEKQRSEPIEFVEHEVLHNAAQLSEYEAEVLAAGYEGVMLRDPNGPYKFGRSTEKEGFLLKLKRFIDSEAVVLDVNPLMHNTNEAVVNELGYKERSSKKAGKVADQKLGSLLVRDRETGVIFDIGSGFNDAQRIEMWKNKPIGKIVKYKSQPVGVKDRPRFPVFIGFRDERDM